MMLAAAAVFVCSVLLQFLFGSGPDSQSPEAPALPAWELPQAKVVDFVGVDARWEARPPWSLPPRMAEVAPIADEAPPPVPVGIARGRQGFEAIFKVPGAGDLRLAVGGTLPDGGRVLGVSSRLVEWVDGKGREQQHEMFNSYRVQDEPATAGPAPAAPPSPRRRR